MPPRLKENLSGWYIPLVGRHCATPLGGAAWSIVVEMNTKDEREFFRKVMIFRGNTPRVGQQPILAGCQRSPRLRTKIKNA